jgi:hypothetical protein
LRCCAPAGETIRSIAQAASARRAERMQEASFIIVVLST